MGRLAALSALVAPLAVGSAVGRVLEKGTPAPGPAKGPPAWKRKINSHEAFTHDSIDSLGYDWERIADPSIAPRFPLKIYLPQTTEDIVRVVKEARALGEKLTIRSVGHSSNDLVLSEGGTILLTAKLDDILEIDEGAMTATVQAGAVSANVDEALALRDLGLPIIGDHNHITVGGFSSVGGISPASHVHGMFIDTIQRFEYVNWEGELIACSREENSADFHRVLAGLGRHGVIATITVRIVRVKKFETVLKNRQRHYRSVDGFIKGSARRIRNPGSALLERGVFVNLPVKSGRTLCLGQFSGYHTTGQSSYKTARDRIAYNALHLLGLAGGRVPKGLDRTLKTVGQLGVMFSPKYATQKNVEFFTDKILDSTVGDPSRMLIVLAPHDRYEEIFRQGYRLMLDYRERFGCFSFVSVYVKSIRSPYLANGTDRDGFSEMTFFLGITERMTPEILDQVATKLDDITIANHGFRYMHTKTSKDPGRLRRVDPNQQYLGGPTNQQPQGAEDEP